MTRRMQWNELNEESHTYKDTVDLLVEDHHQRILPYLGPTDCLFAQVQVPYLQQAVTYRTYLIVQQAGLSSLFAWSQ